MTTMTISPSDPIKALIEEQLKPERSTPSITLALS